MNTTLQPRQYPGIWLVLIRPDGVIIDSMEMTRLPPQAQQVIEGLMLLSGERRPGGWRTAYTKDESALGRHENETFLHPTFAQAAGAAITLETHEH